MGQLFFASFRPDANALLRRLSELIDDSMLREIAEADRGTDFEQHLTALLLLRDHGTIDTPMRWHPREVLELTRWSEPDDPNFVGGPKGERGHRMRAFACAAMLRAVAHRREDHLRSGFIPTLMQLIDSLTALGPKWQAPAAAFLAWLLHEADQQLASADEGFLLVGLLWYGLQVTEIIDDDAVFELSERIDATVQRALRQALSPQPERWLLGSNFFDVRPGRWEQLGSAIVALDLSGRCVAVQEYARLIGRSLAGG